MIHKAAASDCHKKSTPAASAAMLITVDIFLSRVHSIPSALRVKKIPGTKKYPVRPHVFHVRAVVHYYFDHYDDEYGSSKWYSGRVRHK